MSSPPALWACDRLGNGRLGCNAPGREGRSEPKCPAHQKVPTHDPYNMGCNGRTARLPALQTFVYNRTYFIQRLLWMQWQVGSQHHRRPLKRLFQGSRHRTAARSKESV